MTDRKTLYNGLSYAAWGYLFLYVDLNLNGVSILPRFVGWLLFLAAVEKLKEARRNLALLRPLGAVMVDWTALDWAASWAGADIDGRFLPLDLLTGVAGLYFQFQFLTDMAALAETCVPEEPALRRQILRCRTMQTVLLTVFALAGRLPSPPTGQLAGLTFTALIIAYLAAGLLLTAAMFTLRRRFRDAPSG